MKRLNLTGQKFGRWTVIGDSPDRFKCSCQCTCGTLRDVHRGSLRKGTSPSCGCITKERCMKQGTHGQSGRQNGNVETAEYRIWSGMKKRCYNPNAQRYENYGGRGITICERWRDFQNFFGDMGPRPSPKHSIERTDNNIGYCKSNCKWATKEEQARNKTNSINVIVEGVQMPLIVAAKTLGITYISAYRRIQSGKLEKVAAFPMQEIRTFCGF